MRGRRETSAIQDARRDLAEAEKAYRDRCRAAEQQVEAVKRARGDRIEDARKELERAERDSQSRLTRAERALEQARTGDLEAELSGVRLFPNRLEAPDGVVELSSAVRATVAATGTKTEKTGARETVLLLHTPLFESVIRISPSATKQARKFAEKVNTAAENAEARRQAYDDALTAAKTEIFRARCDRDAVEEAHAALAAAEADTADVSRAEQIVLQAKSETTEVDEARARLLELDPQATLRSTDELQRRSRGAATQGLWQRRSRGGKSAIVVTLLLIAITTLGAFLDDANPESERPRLVEQVELTIDQPSSEAVTISTDELKVAGRVTQGGTIQINGKNVPVQNRAYRASVPLEPGQNYVTVRGKKPGYSDRTVTLSVTQKDPAVTLRLIAPDLDESAPRVEVRRFTIRGVATRGSAVRLNGRRVKLRGIHFAKRVRLKVGRNEFRVDATKQGHDPSETSFAIQRDLSPAELAANRRDRAQQAARRARRAFIRRAVSVPYNQLINDPGAYRGSRVKYYGRIFQVSETGGVGRMLLEVTNRGFGVWGDAIWVNYRQHLRRARGDFVTVYGIAAGNKTYPTQIGGEVTVPQVNARYITR